jgi:hypothetical protein
MAEEPKGRSFWDTLPGLLTAAAAVLTAVVGAIVGLHQAGTLKRTDDSPTPSAISQ